MQIAQLVARQSSLKKKTGKQVNCRMRLKNTTPVTPVGKPQAAAKDLLLLKTRAYLKAKVFALSFPTEGSEMCVFTGRFQVMGCDADNRVSVLASHCL